MSDSDDDYMSDKLLTTCETQDIRPGLIFNKTQKRTHDLYKKQITEKAKKPKTYREQEKETREKGLSTAISADNIGFKLLQKMGYKEGKSLGKDESGIKEPINVALKESTSGVGREKHVEDIVKRKSKLNEQNLIMLEKEYLAARHDKVVQNLLRRDYFKSQRICEELDEKEGVEEPLQSHFWTKQTMKDLAESSEDSESDEEEEEVVTEEKLQQILDYLREQYWYCLYCGIKGTGMEDLQANCPGPYRDDHSDDLD